MCSAAATPTTAMTLTDPRSGASYQLPIREGTAGPPVIDVQNLYREAGCFTFDPGYKATASCESGLTFVDGEEGILLYRGYPIEELAADSEFLEVCYLLLHGELPNAAQKEVFERTITRHTMVHEQLNNFYRGFRRDAHPMAIMCGVVGALSAFYHDSTDIDDPEQRLIAAHRLIAKMPTIAAMAYKYALGIRPMFHWTPRRIGAHVKLCVLASLPPANSGRPRRGHGFPRSHGPPEPRVGGQWLTLPYRRRRSVQRNAESFSW